MTLITNVNEVNEIPKGSYECQRTSVKDIYCSDRNCSIPQYLTTCTNIQKWITQHPFNAHGMKMLGYASTLGIFMIIACLSTRMIAIAIALVGMAADTLNTCRGGNR